MNSPPKGWSWSTKPVERQNGVTYKLTLRVIELLRQLRNVKEIHAFIDQVKVKNTIVWLQQHVGFPLHRGNVFPFSFAAQSCIKCCSLFLRLPGDEWAGQRVVSKRWWNGSPCHLVSCGARHEESLYSFKTHCASIGLESRRWMIDCNLTFSFKWIRLEFLPDFGSHCLRCVMRLAAMIVFSWVSLWEFLGDWLACWILLFSSRYSWFSRLLLWIQLGCNCSSCVLPIRLLLMFPWYTPGLFLAMRWKHVLLHPWLSFQRKQARIASFAYRYCSRIVINLSERVVLTADFCIAHDENFLAYSSDSDLTSNGSTGAPGDSKYFIAESFLQ